MIMMIIIVLSVVKGGKSPIYLLAVLGFGEQVLDLVSLNFLCVITSHQSSLGEVSMDEDLSHCGFCTSVDIQWQTLC